MCDQCRTLHDSLAWSGMGLAMRDYRTHAYDYDTLRLHELLCMHSCMIVHLFSKCIDYINVLMSVLCGLSACIFCANLFYFCVHAHMIYACRKFIEYTF